METYKIDWKDVVYGTIEIDAENGLDAENKLMNMSLKELLEKSKYVSDDKGREIRFVDTNDSFIDSMEEKEWNELYKLSEDTFVEETDSLKQTGAGAGLTDNY